MSNNVSFIYVTHRKQEKKYNGKLIIGTRDKNYTFNVCADGQGELLKQMCFKLVSKRWKNFKISSFRMCVF